MLRVNSSPALCVCGFDDSGFPQQKSMKQLSLCPFFLILISNSVKKACTTLFIPRPVNNSCSPFLPFFCLYLLKPSGNVEALLWFLSVPSLQTFKQPPFWGQCLGQLKSLLPSTKTPTRDKNWSLLIVSACFVTNARLHLNSWTQGHYN